MKYQDRNLDSPDAPNTESVGTKLSCLQQAITEIERLVGEIDTKMNGPRPLNDAAKKPEPCGLLSVISDTNLRLESLIKDLIYINNLLG